MEQGQQSNYSDGRFVPRVELVSITKTLLRPGD